MSRFINKNLKFLYQSWSEQRYSETGILLSGKRGVVLEGSSRSGKSIACIDFIILLCTRFETNCTINIIKETYNEFKTTLYKDFSKRLSDYGLNNPFEEKQEISSFYIFGNKINFLGADKPSKFHGAQCDYFWVNEALAVSKLIFDQQEMRCTKFWFMDYNPSVTEHWLFDSVVVRPDVGFLHTTFLDNPFCSIQEKNKILSYEPTQKNIENGTADDYMWKVYGLGLRMNRDGLVFPNVEWINSFPEEFERVFYGLDFGYSVDPTALCKIGINSRNIYLEKKLYTPFDNALKLGEILEQIITKDDIVWADSADPGMISDLNNLGFQIFAAKKFKGCIKYRVDILNRYKIHIVKDKDFKKEQENYSYRVINGIKLNEPDPNSKHCHLWDAAGYAGQHELR